ncbi:MAG TPA: response regulator [Polyangia bacterium]
MKKQVRILIVDDEPIIREVLQVAFEEQAWQVMKADSGEDAARRLEDEQFEVLVVDKNLPGMSGVEFIREVRKRDRTIRILLITAYGSVESAVETLNLGIDAYLEKPFPNVYDVARSVKVALGRFDDRWLSDLAPSADSSGRAAAPVAGGRNLAVVVGAPDERIRTWILQHVERRDAVEAYGTAAEVLEAVRRRAPDLFIVEAGFAQPDTTELIAQVRKAAPRVACIVIAESLPLVAIRALIDLQVQTLIDTKVDSEKLRRQINDLVGRLRTAAHV